MESIRLKLLVPACCPNCGYNLQPDNPILPVKLMNAVGTPGEKTIEGLFNYVKPPVEPPVAPKRSRSKTPPRSRRSPYKSKSQVNDQDGRQSRGGKGRGRCRNRKPKFVPEAGPTINPIQKRLLEIASNEANDPPLGPCPTKQETSDFWEPFEPFVPTVDLVKDEPKPAIPYMECSVPCSQFTQQDVDKFLTDFLADIEGQKTGSPEKPKPQVPKVEPRPTKLPWKGYRGLKPEDFVLQSGDPPVFDPFSGATPNSRVAAAATSGSGRVVAIHNHFYGETVVIPDTP